MTAAVVAYVTLPPKAALWDCSDEERDRSVEAVEASFAHSHVQHSPLAKLSVHLLTVTKR
jgi:hypothetical protein